MKADNEKRNLSDGEKRAAAKAAGVDKLLAFEAENFKKIRVLRLDKLGHIVEFTGKNGQGKTSALDALWFLLKGKAALPVKALRNGAEKLRVKGVFGAFTVTRTLGQDSALPTLTLEMAKGKTAWDTPQAMLDGIVGELAFDPLAFTRMTPAEQVETLRKAVVLDVDIDDLNNANEIDYAERTLVNRQVKQLEAQLNNMTALEGLPKEKLDESAILAKLDEAAEANRRMQETFKAKQDLGQAVTQARQAFEGGEREAERITQTIAVLETQLKQAKDNLKIMSDKNKTLGKALTEAERAHEAAPSGEPVDVGALTAELQSAQRTNRAIEDRQRYDKVKAELTAKEKEAQALSDKMAGREEKKRKALREAKIPVEGLSFDEAKVTFNGLPLANLGEDVAEAQAVGHLTWRL